MYRTPSHKKDAGNYAQSVMSPARSNRMSTYSTHTAGGQHRDQIIHNLKKELSELKSGFRGLGNITSRLSTVEHKYSLMNQDKQIIEETSRIKESGHQNSISYSESDIHELKKRIERRNREIKSLKEEFNRLEREVSSNENAVALMEGKLQDEVDNHEKLVIVKVALDSESSSAQKDVIELRNRLQLIQDDNSKMEDQITKQTRLHRELKSRVEEDNQQIQSKKQVVYGLEAEVKNLLMSLAQKDKDLQRKSEKAELLSGEISIMEGEIEKNHHDIILADDTQRALIEIRAELNRKYTAFARDKDNQIETINEISGKIETERKLLSEQETRKVNLQNTIKNLKNALSKIRGEARKATQSLIPIIETTEAVRYGLDRTERVNTLLDEASAEIARAIRVARE